MTAVLLMVVALPYGGISLPPTLPALPETVLADLTWYHPETCPEHPINCFDADVWWRMAAGHDARQWYGRALACPEEFPIGTRFEISGSRYGLADGDWVCLDRGGAIVIGENGVVRLDLLMRAPIWRETLSVEVVYP